MSVCGEFGASMQEKIKKAIENEGFRVKDDHRCYLILCNILGRENPSCPECFESSENAHLHRVAKKTIFAWQCPLCDSVYNAWTETILQGLHRRPIELLFLFFVVVEGHYNIAELSSKLGRDRKQLGSLLRKIESFVDGNDNLSHADGALKKCHGETKTKDSERAEKRATTLARLLQRQKDLNDQMAREKSLSAKELEEQREIARKLDEAKKVKRLNFPGGREELKKIICADFEIRIIFNSFLTNLGMKVQRDNMFSALSSPGEAKVTDEAQFGPRNHELHDLYFVIESDDEAEADWLKAGPQTSSFQSSYIEKNPDDEAVLDSVKSDCPTCWDKYKRCPVEFVPQLDEKLASIQLCLPGRLAGVAPATVPVLSDRTLDEDRSVCALIPRLHWVSIPRREDWIPDRGYNPMDCFILLRSSVQYHSTDIESCVADPYCFLDKHGSADFLLDFRFQFMTPVPPPNRFFPAPPRERIATMEDDPAYISPEMQIQLHYNRTLKRQTQEILHELLKLEESDKAFGPPFAFWGGPIDDFISVIHLIFPQHGHATWRSIHQTFLRFSECHFDAEKAAMKKLKEMERYRL